VRRSVWVILDSCVKHQHFDRIDNSCDNTNCLDYFDVSEILRVLLQIVLSELFGRWPWETSNVSVSRAEWGPAHQNFIASEDQLNLFLRVVPSTCIWNSHQRLPQNEVWELNFDLLIFIGFERFAQIKQNNWQNQRSEAIISKARILLNVYFLS
jgi:hypothetical protein